MFKTTLTCFLIFCLVLTIPGGAARAVGNAPAMAVPNGLSILEMKITGDEFVILQNNTLTALDVSNYWLSVYNNVSPLSAGVSSSSQQLPAVVLQPSQTLLLSASPMQTCGASVAGKLSLGLTDGGGFLQLSSSSFTASGAISQSSGDYVSWSSGAGGVIMNVPSSTKAPKAAYYRYSKGGSYAWQQADLDTSDGCQLNVLVAGGSGSSSAVTPLNLVATSPPATILGTVTSGDSASIAVLPSSDIGLVSPQISELLPNPIGTGNDGTEEFIELYNPNTKPFDLTGFILQTGLTSLKTYVFPEGSSIAPASFKAFSAADTKLSLSNTSSQVMLLDPFGHPISNSDTYKNAKDGIAWALANGKWFWTTKPTPNAANVIQQPVSKKTSSKTKTTKKLTAKPAVKGTSTVNARALPNSGSFNQAEQGSVVHYRVLALVAGLALLYACYEYRRDLGYRLQRCAAKFGLGRKARPDAARTGSDRTGE